MNRTSEGVAGDAVPVAGVVVTVVPGGEDGVRVVEVEFDFLEVETFLVERENELRREKEEEL